MATRAPSRPPVIEGYSPVQLIGTGGYADVFLYEQHMPHRKVAVKVLVGDGSNRALRDRQFTAEANLMARVSTHPYIVSIFHADIAKDHRPYLVMEYYPGDNYLRRARREQFGVAEVLRIGVQVGSAIATAHRAGILHRDIKPANILTSEFRRPGLTDFGIAAAQGPGDEETAGVSVPWSPPEAFGSGELGVAADVYSLAATLYHLLAGRAPYEVLAGDNGSLAQMSRIDRGQLPSLGRADVPPSLERLLAQAMATNPGHRPAEVVDLLRQLQGVEAELRLSVTPLELADDGQVGRDRLVDDDDATRVKGVREISAQGTPAAISSVPAVAPGEYTSPAERRREGLLAEPDVADTQIVRPVPAKVRDAKPVSQPTKWIAAGAAVLAIAGGGLAIAALTGSDPPVPATRQPEEAEVNDGFGEIVVAFPVRDLSGVRNADGTYSFTWKAADSDGVRYLVSEGDQPPEPVPTTTYQTDQSCISVVTMLATGQRSAPVKACVS